MSERKILHDFVFNLVVPIVVSISFIIWRALSLEEIYTNLTSVNDFALNFLKDFFLFLILPILIMIDVVDYFSRHGSVVGPQVWGIRLIAKIIYSILFLSLIFQFFS